ncbi:uncharacterized protein LOC114541149 [Dendronephthya gigantea]|uniref:uncharacterized protein LOC114541149 n=1 Tax=Dendronephthya gigantea TaxID=151771 RepID=UPI001068D36E|nr:uncharacterized protein LOC114541149 [Dendronephthya gigantea]
MAMLYSCEMCSGNRVPFVALNMALIINHYGRYHRHDPDFFVTCKVGGCTASYKKFEGYKSHLRRFHKDIDQIPINKEGDVDDVVNGEEDIQDDQCRMMIDDHEETIGYHHVDLKRQNALFLLKTKEMYRLTQTATDALVSCTTSIVKNSIEQLKNRVTKCLDNVGMLLGDIPGLENMFRQDSNESNPFNGLQTKTEQKCYFRDNFGLVDPERYILGHNHVQVRSGVHRKRSAKFDEMVIIPLLKSLEAMLNEPSILYEIKHSHKSRQPGRICDFCDGELFQRHPLFSKDKSALQIILYYDEVECVNPLGSKTKKHKLGLFYYTLGNISPVHRSQLKSIQLLAIVKRPLIIKYGMNAILAPIMEQVLELEQDGGYQFTIKGVKESFAGTIAFVSGDNLGSQELGGFKVGPGSHLKCRDCLGKTEDIKTKFREDQFVLRTADEHDDQCDEIDEDPTLASTYGINFRSALCQSRYFHVIGGLPGDSMHDILEGCLQYEAKELLKYLIQERKYFNLQYLNSSLESFDFGYQMRRITIGISDATLNSDSNNLHQKGMYHN